MKAIFAANFMLYWLTSEMKRVDQSVVSRKFPSAEPAATKFLHCNLDALPAANALVHDVANF